MLGVGRAPRTLHTTVLLRPETGARVLSMISTDSGGTGEQRGSQGENLGDFN